MTMRKCEQCGGPGPCLYDHDQKYKCQACHSDPDDSFFKRDPKGSGSAETKGPKNESSRNQQLRT